MWRVTTVTGLSAVGTKVRFSLREISPFIYARDTNKAYKFLSHTVYFPDSEQVIRFRQRKRRRSRDVREHPIRLDRVCLRVYAHFWRSTVPFHVLLLHTSAVLHGLEPPRETVRLNHSRGDRNLGDERDRIKRRRCRLCAPHRSGVHWLYCGDRGVRVPHLRGVRCAILNRQGLPT